MTQPQLMRQIADAMERNPQGWWKDIQHLDNTDVWFDSHSPVDVFEAICDERAVRPKPRTYTLHVQEMPEPEYYDSGIDSTVCAFYLHVQYPDEPTAREALEKLTKAMGGFND